MCTDFDDVTNFRSQQDFHGFPVIRKLVRITTECGLEDWLYAREISTNTMFPLFIRHGLPVRLRRRPETDWHSVHWDWFRNRNIYFMTQKSEAHTGILTRRSIHFVLLSIILQSISVTSHAYQKRKDVKAWRELREATIGNRLQILNTDTCAQL